MEDIEQLNWSLDLATIPVKSRAGDIRGLLIRAAAEWNRVFQGVARFQEVSNGGHILVRFGLVDRTLDKSRIAQCSDFPGKRWIITFAQDQKWQISPMQRFFSVGEPFLAAAVHELGHVFDLPHSDDPSDVMHHQILNWEILPEEAAHYRKLFTSKL